jgi:hypothetical protein
MRRIDVQSAGLRTNLRSGGADFFGGRIMTARRLDRRVALASLGVLMLAPRVAARQAGGHVGAYAPAIRVDVSPLRASSGDPTATWVAEALPAALAASLAGRLPPGVTLTARIDLVMLGPSTGGTGPNGSSPDQMIGVLFVSGPRGSIASGTPLRATNWYYPMAVDQPLVVESNHDRVTALSQVFASWVPRELGL